MTPDPWSEMTPGALGRLLLHNEPAAIADELAVWLTTGEGEIGGPWAETDRHRVAIRLRHIATRLDEPGP